MKYIVAFMIVALMGAAAAQSKPWDEPWFCHGINCPSYTVVQNTSEYEVREYPAHLWASTQILGIDLDKADDTGFGRLFKYISGANVASEKIEMTAPVRTFVSPGQGPNCGSNFTVSFYVPYAYQPPNPAPPQATSDDVFIEHSPAMRVAVISYGGFPSQTTAVAHADTLAKALTADGVAFDAKTWFAASYDPPFRIVDRHNEVWFVVDQ